MPEREDLGEKHSRIARRFIAAAHGYLSEGDVIQASEKLWGATAHAIKVYCITRGWQHSRYAHLKRAMLLLGEETGDGFWADGFDVAYRNHLNFYIDDKDVASVDSDLVRVRRMVARLLDLAGENNGNPVQLG